MGVEPLSAEPQGISRDIGDAAFRMVSARLREATGIVLSDAKRGLAVSRLTRRLRALNLPDFNAYCEVLQGPHGAAELQEMILLLTTNVTRFFREGHHFDRLRDDILPPLIERAKAGRAVRIWSAGCSSGEEAYSIAMTVLDVCPRAPDLDIRILATDIDRNMIAIGREGRYRLSPEDQLAHPLLASHLGAAAGADTNLWEVSGPVRSLVTFAELNLLHPWPMNGKFDVIFCRNVVIYFDGETQATLWPRFADALAPGGHLIVGHSERVNGAAAARLRSCGVTQYQLQA